ncbi:hypothetical protein V1477_010518 [Vespula maculifrons]|uniref:Uncharacterized protein n=1 Tax=Vespula maculifrons TaxID=7453 RepID=A0ABD2C4S6_VESMC
MSTYLIFNQLQIIHPQFRHKSRSGVLEPSQNFLSNQDRVFLLKRLWSGHEAKERLYVEEAPIKCGSKGIYNTIELFSTVPQNSSKMALSHILILPCCHSKCSYIVVIHDRSCLEMSEADGVDVGAFCKRGFIQLQFPEKLEAPEAERHHGSWILEHDRSCLEMSEADGVDGGAFCKRGFIHLQFAEKLESPKAERHLGSWILEHDRSCLEMSEADGVDGGAICKRGFIHLQFAEKLEAPEAEKHHVSWILE